jgi:hypothetical protein
VPEHPSFPGSAFPLPEELPSDKAELRIFLIDPDGLHMPVRWLSDQGMTGLYAERDTTWNRHGLGEEWPS